MALMEGLIIGGLIGGGYYYYDNYLANGSKPRQQKVQSQPRPAIMDSEFYPISTSRNNNAPKVMAKPAPQKPQRFISYQTQTYYPTQARKPADSCMNPDYVYDYESHRYVSVCLPY